MRGAWVGAILIGLLQLIVPVALILYALFHAFVGAFNTPTPEVEGPTVHDGYVWYTQPKPREEGEEVFATPEGRDLMRVPLGTEAPPEIVADLPGGSDDPVLVKTPDGLWAVGREAASLYTGSSVETIAYAETLPSDVWPVSLDGALAVVTAEHDWDSDGTKLQLRTLEGTQWQPMHTAYVDEELDIDELRVVSTAAGLELFASGYERPIHHAVWKDGAQLQWESTKVAADIWTATALDGKPVLLTLEDTAESSVIVGHRQTIGWRQFMAHDAGLAIRLGAASVEGGDLVAVVDTSFDGLAVKRIAPAGDVVSDTEHSASTIWSETIGLIVGSQVAPLLFTGLFALLLSGRLRRHRVAEHNYGSKMALHATLARRTIAKGIDSLIAVSVPLLLLVPTLLQGGTFDENYATGVTLLWAVPVGILFIILEGANGQTPGKKLMGIRVVTLELEPCGIGPAFIRNFAGAIDGFFNFLVGLVAVATSQHQQRVGDLAAKTIVIDATIIER